MNTPTKKEVKFVSKRGKKLGPDEVQRARKIEVSLTKEQKKIFQDWNSVYCYTYNRALEISQTKRFKKIKIFTQKPNPKTGKRSFITGWKKLKTYVLDPGRLYDCEPFEQEMLWAEHKEIKYDLKTEACHEVYSRRGSTKESLAARTKM